MKLFDKFLKKLKTDRNTFLTYLLTLISFYLCIDRVVEILLIGLTGISVDYWGPIKYTFALACPVAAFYLSGASKFVTEDKVKLSFLYIYTIALYIMSISMVIQWVNQLSWALLFWVPNYRYIILTFPDLIKPALSAFAWYLPVCTFYPLFKWLYMVVDDTKDLRDSIFDYGGIDLSDKSEGMGPYTCEMFLCRDKESGKSIKTPEARRFEASLIVGVSGSGKTSMMFEPMIARDLERKYFFKESAKEFGYTALRTGLATLNTPYSNDYLNENFSLNMLTPVPYKEKVYKAFVQKLTYHYNGQNSVYKNLGITYLAPDYESLSHMKDVAENFNIKYKVIDPNDNSSIGLNPFIFDDPIKTSIAISSVLKRMYHTEMNPSNTQSSTEAFMHNIVTQAVENLTLLLKEMYPLLHDNQLPTLEDLLNLLNDFDKIEVLAEQMKQIPELAEKYNIQLGYFKKTFYKGANGREETERYLQASAAQLENLLRYPGVKNILCNRVNNINYDKALADGEVIFVCTRRGDLGASVHKAFGLFYLLLMQHSVLSRPGNEKTRIPHFLYVDEFPPFVCKATEDIFTLYRKYRVGTIISAQNLSQFGINNDYNFRQTIMANCTTKIVFGNNTPEDNDWWSKEFGEKREWKFNNTYQTDKGRYDPNYSMISWAWKENYKPGKVQSLKFKAIIYKTKDLKGKSLVGSAKVDFLESKYKEKQKVKTFNFEKFANSIDYKKEDANANKKPKFSFKEEIDFTGESATGYVTDNAIFNVPNDSARYTFDEENAITSYNNSIAIKKPKDNKSNNDNNSSSEANKK